MKNMKSEAIFNLRVYYEDTDAGGVVYHANYLHFMERARTELFFTQHLKDYEKCLFIVNQVELDFIRPARLYDQLEVVTKIVELRGATILFEQIVRSALDRNLLFCQGLVRVVNVNANLKPTRLPKSLIEKLSC
jgi:acyl-CoA thioester hydrolase